MAELVKAEVTVSKEAYELGIALGKLAIAAKAAMKDGISLDDAPAMLSALMSKEVMDGLAGLEMIGEELKQNKAAFVAAFAVAAVKISEQL